MNISRAQADKLVVGTTDVGYLPTDRNPVGTTVLNGPVFVGLPVAAPIYKAVLNVGPPAPPSLPGLNPPLVTPFSMWVDGLSNQVEHSPSPRYAHPERNELCDWTKSH